MSGPIQNCAVAPLPGGCNAPSADSDGFRSDGHESAERA
jgi:hypothetical protein